VNDSELSTDIVANMSRFLEGYAYTMATPFAATLDVSTARAIVQSFNFPPADMDFGTITDAPEVVAAALRCYFERHRRAIIPPKAYSSFVDANSVLSTEGRVASLSEAVSKLPPAHRVILERLVHVLHLVAAHAEYTGQDASALGAIFGDTVLHGGESVAGGNSRGKGEGASGADMMAFMIEHFYGVVFAGCYRAESAPTVLSTSMGEGDWSLLLTNAKLFKYRKDQPVVTEGAPLEALFRVRHGVFEVRKGDAIVATLRADALFGEVAFLGTYISEATVSAATDDAEVWLLDLAFLNQMFLMEPELAMRFYAHVARSIADRVTYLLEARARGETPSPYVLQRATPALPTSADPSSTSSSTATALLEETVIRDYPCKLDKDGTLYIMQHYLSHFAPVFGRERKKVVPYEDVSSVTMADNMRDILVERRGRNKVSRLSFYSEADCDEAFSLLETMLVSRQTSALETAATSFIGDASKRKVGVVSARWSGVLGGESDSARSPSLSVRTDDELNVAAQHTRAVALFDFAGTSDADLPLRVNDVVIVVQKREDGWWLGKCGDKVGVFPSNYVRDDEGMPSIEDWETVWLGGRSREYRKVGTTVVAAGAEAPGLFQVLHGSVKVLLDGKEVGVLQREETFCEDSFVADSSVRPSFVTASPRTTIREIPRSWLHRIFERAPLLGARVYKYLAVVLEMRLRAQLEDQWPSEGSKSSADTVSTRKQKGDKKGDKEGDKKGDKKAGKKGGKKAGKSSTQAGTKAKKTKGKSSKKSKE